MLTKQEKREIVISMTIGFMWGLGAGALLMLHLIIVVSQ